MMTFLANIGSSTATIFKFIYLKIDIIKRRFRFKKIRSDVLFRSDQFDNNFYDNLEIKRGNKTDSIKKTSKLSFKSDHDSEKKQSIVDSSLQAENQLKPNDSKDKNLSSLKSTLSDSRKSILVNNKDVKFEAQLIIDDKVTLSSDNNEKLVDATKRIDNLIELNLDKKFEDKKDIEFHLNKDTDDTDDEDNSKLNQFLIPNILKYLLNEQNLFKSINYKNFLIWRIANETGLATSSHKPIELNELKPNKKSKKKSKKEEVKESKSVNLEKKPSRFDKFKKSFKILNNRKEPAVLVKKEEENIKKEVSQSLPDIKKEFKPEIPEDLSTQNEKSGLKESKKSIKQNKNTQLTRSKSLTYYDPKKLHLIYRQYQQEKQEKIGVPIFTVIAIIFGYLFCGMFMFSSFEGKINLLIFINFAFLLIFVSFVQNGNY